MARAIQRGCTSPNQTPVVDLVLAFFAAVLTGGGAGDFGDAADAIGDDADALLWRHGAARSNICRRCWDSWSSDNSSGRRLAMAKFIQRNRWDTALRGRDWRAFARGYNGHNFEENDYGKKLVAAFAQYSISLPDLNLRTAQVLLTYLGFHPGAALR